MKRLIMTLLAVTILFGSGLAKTYAAPGDTAVETFTVTASVTDKFGMKQWGKRMSGKGDPGTEGDPYDFNSLDFGTLVWENGRALPASGRWYALFFGMDANGRYSLTVTADANAFTINAGGSTSDISESVLVTADFIAEDKWDPTDATTEQGAAEAGETVLVAGDDWKAATQSVSTIKSGSGFKIYESGPAAKARIIRSYISIFNYDDPNDPDAVSNADKDSVGKPLKSAAPGDYTGTITYTMLAL